MAINIASMLSDSILKKKTGVTALPSMTPNSGVVKPGTTGISAAKSGSLTMPYTPGSGTSANTGINGGVTRLPNVSGGIALPSTATKMTSGVTLPSSTSGMQTMSASTGNGSALSSAMITEIQRKAAAGIPLDEPTPEKTAIYNQAKGTAGATGTTGTAGKTGTSSGGVVATPSNSASNTPVVQYSNDYIDKATQLMAQMEQMMNTGYQAYDYAKDPTYIAAQQLAQAGAKSASTNAMESMNDRGIINSTLMGNQLAQIEQQAQLKPMELIPQLQAADYSKYQDNMSNLAALMNTYLQTGQGQLDYSQNKAVQDGTMTGDYISPELAWLLNQATGQDPMLTQNPAGASTMSPNKIAEIQRKAKAGIPLDEPTAEAMAIYTAAGGKASTGTSKSTSSSGSSSSSTKSSSSSSSSSSSTKSSSSTATKTGNAKVDADEKAYLTNMANGKNSDGTAVSAGQIAWAKAQLKNF